MENDIRFYSRSALHTLVENVNIQKLDDNARRLTTTRFITWEDITSFAYFVDNIYRTGGYSSLMGIPRAGMFLALYVSLLFGHPLVFAPTEGVLIIDDDTISGTNLLPYYDKGDSVMFGVYPDAPLLPTYVFCHFETGERIIYPWDLNGIRR